MTDKRTWQKLETKVAKSLKGKRNPLSGRSSRHTAGDVIHDNFYVECKLREKMAVWSFFREAEEKAKKEGKIPLLILKEKNKHGELIALRLSDFTALLDSEK